MIRNRTIFYLLSFTWGIIMTLVGCLVTLVLLIAGYKPKKWGHCWYFEIGEYWGGLELGPCFLTNKNPSKHTRNHEHGHGFQNCKYGPFMVIISLMSAGRYWYRELKYNRKGVVPPTKYDDIWFEGEATKLGTAFIESISSNI
jgi:hypothetical protein